MRGHTPTMLLRTSTRDGIDSSPVMMARRRLVRDIIQSRCSAPFSRVTMNSVIEKGSKDPKTEEDTFCKHRFRRRRSKMGYSTNFCEYPLPRYSLYVSASTCDPPEIATRDAELPAADQKAENFNYSSKETAAEPSPLRKRSDTRTQSDAQWHGSQWQRNLSQTDLQKNKKW